MARTHTELYRRYEGELATRRLRFWPLVASGVRTGVKKKLPLLLLYAPIVITTIVYSFVVYGKYAAEDFADTVGVGPKGVTAVFAKQAAIHIDVAKNVMGANVTLRWFAMLVIAWFGAGLFADDRRLGAHLLYFSRPLSRLDYFLGKFLTVGSFAALATLVPGLVICLFAAWCSPNWEFLKEEGDLVWQSLAFSSLYIAATTCVVLAISSLVKRKTLALVGVFGIFMPLHVLAKVLSTIDKRFQFVSLFDSMQRIGNWILGIDNPWENQVPLAWAWATVLGVSAVALLVIAARLRRLEVVA